jgi:hypothetical protein
VSVATGAGASNVLESGAVQGSSVVDLSGSTSAPAGAVAGYDSARIVNRGAMAVAEGAYWFPVSGDERPMLRNVGTISAQGGTSTTFAITTSSACSGWIRRNCATPITTDIWHWDAWRRAR